VGRDANQNVYDSCEFTVTDSHRIDLDPQPAGVANALGISSKLCAGWFTTGRDRTRYSAAFPGL
jgi:hypothetical protein